MNKKSMLKQLRNLINNPEYDFDQNFFEAGGTSIQIIEVARIVYEETGMELDMTEFFSNPYIKDIKFLENNEDELNIEKRKPVAVFIHDGSGTSDSYRHFYEVFKKDFEVIRIDFSMDNLTIYPSMLSVDDLAKQYIEQINDFEEIEYLFGWCIGGKIAYEISNHLNDKIKKVVIMNSPAPNDQAPNEITLESERKFIKETFKIPFLKMDNIDSIDGLWKNISTYCDNHNSVFEVIKKLTPTYIKFLIPDFYSDKLTPKYYFKHLNLIRSFSIAHDFYNAKGIVPNSKFYFFNAESQNLDENHRWENFVENGVSYDIPGTHTEIVSKENTLRIVNSVYSDDAR